MESTAGSVSLYSIFEALRMLLSVQSVFVSHSGQLLDNISLTKKKTTKNNEKIIIKRRGARNRRLE